MTHDHANRARAGTLGIIVVCALIQFFVWRNHTAYADARALLRFGSSNCTSGKLQIKGMELAEDYGILGKVGIQVNRAEVVQARLNAMKKASLSYRLSVKARNFNLFNLITSIFTHVDWLHFGFNMWILYLFGSIMERYWGTGRFLGFYAACGILGQMAFLILGGMGGKAAGMALAGSSGAIAGLVAAFALTHGWAKVGIPTAFGFGSSIAISPRLYLGVWVAGQFLDGVLLGGHSGGASISTLMVGCLAGLAMAKWMPVDPGYLKPGIPESLETAEERLIRDGTPDLPEAPKRIAESLEHPLSRERELEVLGLLDRSRKAQTQENGRAAGIYLFEALEKAFALVPMQTRSLEISLSMVLEFPPSMPLPAGALYSWARRLEQLGSWQWAIRIYDIAALDPSGVDNPHLGQNSRFQAAVLRMEHGIEKDRARAGLQWILETESAGHLAKEAEDRLAILNS